MRKAVPASVLALVAAAVAVSVAAATGSFSRSSDPRDRQQATSTGNASLRLIASDPLTIKGLGFKNRERVRVSLTGAGSTTRHVRAGRRGSFVVRFGRVSCGSLTIVAVGRRGSRAALNYSAIVCR